MRAKKVESEKKIAVKETSEKRGERRKRRVKKEAI